ncbi:hypothetical protein P5G51_013000 [Virgibacillus sp. 179-BFC.A HS]|uniref:Uncharacterized protein n=1 Tax=Tigheibacillus jepli TaxID=3035914 RepID=A0ABU5CIN4_9BACI|nr:hypothetical protein [Virgibacillus sp. 179-BFC.A HS]MDY0406185.1 hypothetical protein [Virgibacillus sp. 179-BFC.A HS]
MDQGHKHIYDLCKEYMHAYVLVETSSGEKVDGIITGLDDEYVYMAVPIGGGELEIESPSMDESRFFGYPPHPGFGGYGYGYYGGGYYPRPRFRRVILPLVAIAALTLLPWY